MTLGSRSGWLHKEEQEGIGPLRVFNNDRLEPRRRVADAPAPALLPRRRYGGNTLDYVSGAKQASTRESRVDKIVPRILKGKGLRDR